MSKLLIADLTNEKLRREVGGAEFSFPTQKQRAKLRFGLRFSEQTGRRHYPVYPTVEEIRVTVGELDKRPEAGDFSLKVGTDSPVVGTNVTADLAFDFDATALQSALNALSSVSGATVTEDDESFLIRGVVDPITAYGNALRPITFARITSYTVDGETVQALRLQRSPLAFTDSFAQRVPDPPSVMRLAAGGTVGEVPFPEIQQLTIPLDFAGTYRLRTSDNVQKSGLLGVADGPQEVAEAINPTSDNIGLATDADGLFTVTEHPSEPAALIEFGGSMYGVSHDLLNVEVFAAPEGDYWVTLDFDTAPMAERFREVDEIRVPIEIFADFDGETDVPVYRGEVTIVESITHDDLGTAQNIDFLEPPAAKDYQPVSSSSISTGVRFYPFLIGDGSATGPFAITHSLDSPRTNVFLRENATNGNALVEGTDFSVVYNDDDLLTITLLGSYAGSPPANEALLGTVQDLTVTNTWLEVEHAIESNTGLRPELDGIHEWIAYFRNNLGTNRKLSISSGTTAGLGPSWAFPSLFEAYPSRESIDGSGVGRLVDLDLSPLGRARGLLPAVHDASVESLTAALPSPSSVYLGRVFRNDWQRFQVRSGEGHRFGYSEVGEFLACDGRTWYPVKKYGRHENGVPFTTDFAEDDMLLSAEQNEFPAGTKVVLTTTGTLPDPLATSTTYFVRDRTRDTLTLAATETGDAIPLTDDGTGTHMLYKVAESSYYPAVFERELFRVEVTEEMLHVGSLFETHIALELATYAANTNAFWTLAFEVGEKLVDDAPGTPGHNLARIRWRGTPILEQPIVLTPNAAVHRFGLEVGRALVDSVDTLSATGHIYGATDESLVPPNAAGFLLRARLIRFDTENNQPDPDGFVLMRGLTSDSPDAPQIEGGARIR